MLRLIPGLSTDESFKPVMHGFTARLRRLRLFALEFARDRVALISLIVLLILVGIAWAAPFLPLADPKAFAFDQYTAPSVQHLMGTDNFGRSMLSQVVWGGRLAILIGLISAGIAVGLGTVLGAVSGYFGGWLDDVLSRSFDIFLMIPAFFLALVIIMLFGSNVYYIVLVIGLTMWPRTARIMRAQVLSLKSRQYVLASRTSGASHLQALFLHVVPNGLGPVITQGTILMGVAILIEAALSFLGLGDPSTVSWGRMIFTGQEHLRIAPWMGFFPGLAMLILVCALNLVGDGLNAAVNPQTRLRTGRASKALAGREFAPVPPMPSSNGAGVPLLQLEDVCAYYMLDDDYVRAVDGVSLTVRRGESLGLVGESGCGKTSIGLALMRTLPPNAKVLGGAVYLDGQEILHQSQEEFQQVRWKRMAMIFQSSMNSLNPVRRVGDQLVDAYRLHRPRSTRTEAMQRIQVLFDTVGIPASRIHSFPHEMSGGMRQRVVIALALLLEPELIIADEPTTALDVLVKDQILAELDRLRSQFNLTMILISHDMGVVAETCDRIAVMYAGQIVEEAPTDELFRNPRHPYTRGLIGSLPTLDGPKQDLVAIPGDSALPLGNVTACRFAPRCPLKTDLCVTHDPPTITVEPGHWSRCHYALSPAVDTVWETEAA